MPTTITLRHVSKVFGTGRVADEAALLGPHADPGVQPILDDITLTIRPGEVLAILGPSGCGKTTLLKTIAGLIQPTTGEIQYDGIPLERIPMRERGIGIVFQNYALYPHLPSVDNIGFFLRLRRRAAEIPDRVREISEMMRIDLKPLLGRKPPTLSGGEQQRIAIARCLARDPKVFLFDEPFSNLDAKLRTSARVELKRLLRRFEVTSVYVTHDQLEAVALADRLAILNNGRLMQLGSYSHLYDTPANIFVAGFLGSPAMNLFPGTVSEGGWESKRFSWRPIRSDLEDGMPVILGIRPEHFYPDPDGPIGFTVEMIEQLLSERVQHLHAHFGPQAITVIVPLEFPIAVGETLHVNADGEHIHLFDAETGLQNCLTDFEGKVRSQLGQDRGADPAHVVEVFEGGEGPVFVPVRDDPGRQCRADVRQRLQFSNTGGIDVHDSGVGRRRQRHFPVVSRQREHVDLIAIPQNLGQVDPFRVRVGGQPTGLGDRVAGPAAKGQVHHHAGSRHRTRHVDFDRARRGAGNRSDGWRRSGRGWWGNDRDRSGGGPPEGKYRRPTHDGQDEHQREQRLNPFELRLGLGIRGNHATLHYLSTEPARKDAKKHAAQPNASRPTTSAMTAQESTPPATIRASRLTASGTSAASA